MEDLSVGKKTLVNLVEFMPTMGKEIRRKPKFVRKAIETDSGLSHFVFNLSGEPVKKYSLAEFADKFSVNYVVSD